MKQDHNNHQPFSILHHRRSFTWKNTTTSLRTHYILISYIILLVLTYLLGYFSASSSKQTLNKVTIPTPPPTVKTIPTTGFTAVYNCPPSTSAFPTEHTNYHNDFGPRCENPVQPEFIRSVIIDRVFNGTSPYENFPPPHVAGLLKPKRVKGWGSYGAVFENLIKKTRPRIIVEVGTFLGASAIHMAELTRKLGIETDILCVDDFRGWPGFKTRVNYVPSVNGDVLLYYQFMQNVVSFNLTESIVPVPFSTGSALGKLCEWGVLADLIEVDAGHDFHSAWSDINLAYKLLRPGGVMFGHDYFTAYDNKGVRRAVDLFAKVHGFKVSTDGQHWVLDDRSFYV